MYPHIWFPIAPLLIFLLLICLLVLTIEILPNMLTGLLMSLVHRNYNHLVVFQAGFKDIIECQDLALLGDLNQAERRLAEVQLSVDLSDLF